MRNTSDESYRERTRSLTKIHVLSGRASRQLQSLFMKACGYWTRTAVPILDRIFATESDSFNGGLLLSVTREWESETLFAVLSLPNQFSSRTVFTPLSLRSHLSTTAFTFLVSPTLKVPSFLRASAFTLFLLLSNRRYAVFTPLSLLNNSLPSTNFNLVFVLNPNPCFPYCRYRTAVWAPAFVVVT
jgi:hypothetical protein